MHQDSDGAFAAYDHLIALNPKNSQYYGIRAITKDCDKGDLDGALADYNQTILLDPADFNAFRNRGQLKQKKGDLKGALSDFSQGNSVYFSIWVAAELQGNKADANAELSGRMAKSMGFTRFWPSNVCASLLDQMNQSDFMDAAAATASNARDDGIQHCQTWYYLGIKRLLAGDKSKAADDFRKCLATNQKGENAYFFAQAELKAIEKQP